MSILEEIENEHGFTYPKIYHQLFNDNMLEYGELGPNWYKETYPILKESPPLLLLSNEYEPLAFDDIRREIDSFKDPDDYRQTNKQRINFYSFCYKWSWRPILFFLK